MKRIVAILDTMWDWRGMTSGAGARRAPRFFHIHPKNFTGKRLYQMAGKSNFLVVTESCRELATHAKQHGTPDPAWVSENLKLLEPIDVLLVCGKVAQKTFKESGHKTAALVLEIMHPAARTWTKAMLEDVARKIKSV